MKKPKIKEINALQDNRFISLYDMEYEDGSHYYNASRRKKENLCAWEGKTGLPDAVSGYVALMCPDHVERLLLFQEYRYPTGNYVLSIPSGLIDPDDGEGEEAILKAMKREIHEETGITLKDTDRIEIINPFVFNSPGMTDESTALVAVCADLRNNAELSQEGAEGTEIFDGFDLITKEEAIALLKKGTDSHGIPYPFVTWGAMMWFVNR
ncbi:MAG TPA: NUDIX hydrolase [Erysipelotrichaceae bacterium]|nr:NUDIX hydrolase [Erysipelotrichaceae bacterium]